MLARKIEGQMLGKNLAVAAAGWERWEDAHSTWVLGEEGTVTYSAEELVGLE